MPRFFSIILTYSFIALLIFLLKIFLTSGRKIDKKLDTMTEEDFIAFVLANRDQLQKHFIKGEKRKPNETTWHTSKYFISQQKFPLLKGEYWENFSVIEIKKRIANQTIYKEHDPTVIDLTQKSRFT